MILVSYLVLFSLIDILPAWYYSQYGIQPFVTQLKAEANKIKPWGYWHFVSLDAESKLNFYLNPSSMKQYDIRGVWRNNQTTASLAKTWPFLMNKPKATIFVTRKRYLALLVPFFAGYQQVTLAAPFSFLTDQNQDAPVALIPNEL